MTCQWCDGPLSGRQRMWCSENCRKRACDDRYRKACPDCGGPMATRSGWPSEDRQNERCGGCRTRVDAVARRARIEDVAEMYREGMTMRQIAAELGYSPNSRPPEVTEARKLGLIGYRNRGYGNVA